jgi:hypothetical protein
VGAGLAVELLSLFPPQEDRSCHTTHHEQGEHGDAELSLPKAGRTQDCEPENHCAQCNQDAETRRHVGAHDDGDPLETRDRIDGRRMKAGHRMTYLNLVERERERIQDDAHVASSVNALQSSLWLGF